MEYPSHQPPRLAEQPAPPAPPSASYAPARQPWARPALRRLELQATEFGGAPTDDGDGLGSNLV